jgi:triacylglycerol lipase
MRSRTGFATIAAIGALLALPAGAVAQDKLPVPWTFDSALSAQGAAPDAPPPGANDFSCQPSKRHPRPVVLVHGLFANQTANWQTISPYLANRGFCVFSLTYGTIKGETLGFYQPGGLQKMEASAADLKRFVNRVLTATGARKVDIVGHSEGSLMPNYYVKYLNGARRVAHYVGMTTLWQGTNLLGAGVLEAIGRMFSGGATVPVAGIDQFCPSCREFIQGSEFIKKMNAGGVAAPGVKYTSIVTRNDELVSPYTSGLMPDGPNVTNVVLQNLCPLDQAEHVAVAADPVTAGVIYRALDPTRAPNPPCVPVLPVIGALGYSGD